MDRMTVEEFETKFKWSKCLVPIVGTAYYEKNIYINDSNKVVGTMTAATTEGEPRQFKLYDPPINLEVAHYLTVKEVPYV